MAGSLLGEIGVGNDRKWMGMHRPYRMNRRWAVGVLLPSLVLIAPVLVDLVNGYLVMTGKTGLLSVGVLFRGGITLIGLVCLLKCKMPLVKIFVVALVGTFLIENLVWAAFSSHYSPGYDFNRFFKILFPWLVVAILFYADRFKKQEPIFLFSIMTCVGVLTAASLVFSLLSGRGFETYGSYSYGIKGFFDAQNDTGLTLLLSLVAAIVLFLDDPGMMRLIYIGTIILGCFLLGTRAGFLGPFLVIFCFIFAGILNRRVLLSKFKGTVFTLCSISLIVAFLVGSLGFILKNSKNIDYTLSKIQRLTQETPRSYLQSGGGKRLVSRGPLFTAFGEGGYSFRVAVGKILKTKQSLEDRTPGRLVENDLYDIFGYYGLPVFIIIYSWLIVLLLGALFKATTRFCKINLATLLMIGVYIGHSSVAGHAIFSAQVGNIIGPCFFILVTNLNFFRDREFIAKGVDSMISASILDHLNN